MPRTQEQLRNFQRNDPQLFELWAALPLWTPDMAVKCPTKNMDGTPAEDICGCGSAEVTWDGEVYDCRHCGIFFEDFAADPPHRRED